MVAVDYHQLIVKCPHDKHLCYDNTQSIDIFHNTRPHDLLDKYISADDLRICMCHDCISIDIDLERLTSIYM